MKNHTLKDILDILRECRDAAILRDDMERAMQLSGCILSAGFAEDEATAYRCLEDSVYCLSGADYLSSMKRSLKPLMNSVGIYFV